MVDVVMELTGCGPLDAVRALTEHKSIEDAVDALLTKPTVSGDKYIPAKPKIETGLSEEQEERCKKGRWLQDKVNAVFSVAHSKIQSPPDPLPSEQVAALDQPAQSVSLPLLDEPQPDIPEKTVQSSPQSAKLQ